MILRKERSLPPSFSSQLSETLYLLIKCLSGVSGTMRILHPFGKLENICLFYAPGSAGIPEIKLFLSVYENNIANCEEMKGMRTEINPSNPAAHFYRVQIDCF